MNAEFRKLRLQQLNRALSVYDVARQTIRPRGGWLSALRGARGITLRELASSLKITPQAVRKLQLSEASESISLKRLRQMAEAMECELVYAVLPKNGKLTDVVEERNRKNAAERVLATEHTMTLEDQAAGGVEARIKAEQSIS